MAFKLKAPFSIDNTPVYFVNEEEGVLGRANNNGTITVNNKVENPVQLKEVIKHEKAHVDQFKKFEKSNGKKGLNYNDKYVMKWVMEGGKSLPWEKEAYKKEKQ